MEESRWVVPTNNFRWTRSELNQPPKYEPSRYLIGKYENRNGAHDKEMRIRLCVDGGGCAFDIKQIPADRINAMMRRIKDPKEAAKTTQI